MSDLTQVFLGFLAALVLGMIVFGSTLLALVETGRPLADLPVQAMEVGQPLRTKPGIFRPLKNQPGPAQYLEGLAQAAENSGQILSSNANSATTCGAPSGWGVYVVQPDDTLNGLALRFGLSPQEFAQRNCFDTLINTLPTGAIVNVPIIAPPADQVAVANKNKPGSRSSAQDRSRKQEQCGPPAWWVRYIVRSGNTLYYLSLLTGASIAEIQRANCLGNSTIIRVGQTLYLPYLPPPPIAPTAPRRATATQVISTTWPTVGPTAPYNTPHPTATNTQPTLPPSSTLPPGQTSVPTETTVPEQPPTQTPLPTATSTQPPTPTGSSTQPPASTATSTQPPASTSTPTQAPASTATPQLTALPTDPPPPTTPPTEPPPPTAPPTEPPLPTAQPTQPPPPTAQPTQPPPPASPPTQPPPAEPSPTSIPAALEQPIPEIEAPPPTPTPLPPAGLAHSWSGLWYHPLIQYGLSTLVFIIIIRFLSQVEL